MKLKDAYSLEGMTNLDSIFKSRDFTLPTKVRLVKVMVFPVVMYGCESWTIKKAEHRRIDAFELWCWRRLLRVPWTARRSNQSILKEISPGPLWLSWQRSHLQCRRPGFDPWIGKTPWRSEWQPTPVFLPGEFQGQRTVAGYSLWGPKESDTTERLTHTHDCLTMGC